MKNKKKINFFEKYFISAVNVDKFSKILELKERGSKYLFLLILFFSILSSLIITSIIKPKILNELKNIPNFKIEEGKFIFEDKEENSNSKYYKKEFKIGTIFPNLNSNQILDLKNGIQKEKLNQIKEINNGKNEKELNLVDEYIKKEAKENNISEKELKENINILENSNILVIKDGFIFRVNSEKYIPFSVLINDKNISKTDIYNLTEKNMYKALIPSLIISNIVVMGIIILFMKLAGSIYMSINIIFGNKLIYVIRDIRKKIGNFALSGPLTIFLILQILTIADYIKNIDFFFISVIIYLIYIEIISRIVLNDKDYIKNIMQNYRIQTVIGNPEEIMQDIEENEKAKKEKLKKLKEKEKEEKNSEEERQ